MLMLDWSGKNLYENKKGARMIGRYNSVCWSGARSWRRLSRPVERRFWSVSGTRSPFDSCGLIEHTVYVALRGSNSGTGHVPSIARRMILGEIEECPWGRLQLGVGVSVSMHTDGPRQQVRKFNTRVQTTELEELVVRGIRIYCRRRIIYRWRLLPNLHRKRLLHMVLDMSFQLDMMGSLYGRCRRSQMIGKNKSGTGFGMSNANDNFNAEYPKHLL